LSKDWPQTSKK